ncbi:MAG: hypothetical protein P8107_15435, partial [Spirochaetia bacterium]
ASTIWGGLEVKRLEAADSILAGSIAVADKQRSCVRFTASYNKRELAKAYECYQIKASDQLFVSTRFGHPCYARLSALAPPEIRRGAEDRLEMGAFNFLRDPVKLESLMAKVNEYMPFGLVPLYIFEGEEDG